MVSVTVTGGLWFSGNTLHLHVEGSGFGYPLALPAVMAGVLRGILQYFQ
jgi:hypothetical protein